MSLENVADYWNMCVKKTERNVGEFAKNKTNKKTHYFYTCWENKSFYIEEIGSLNRYRTNILKQ